jgi:hypothetical protein
MTARQDTEDLARAIQARGIPIGFDDAQALRRAEITLSRWAERVCGYSNDWRSWVVERDEETDKPYVVSLVHDTGTRSRYLIPDRERGAIWRVAEICDRLGLTYYHQSDPRGCALYVDSEPIPSNDYTRAVACAAR